MADLIGARMEAEDRMGESEQKKTEVQNRILASFPIENPNPVLYNASVYRDEADQVIGVFAAARDITEHKWVEDLVPQNTARAEAMAEFSRSLVEAGTNPQAILTIVARTTASLIGDASVIRLFSDGRENLEPIAFYHPDPKILELMREKITQIEWRKGLGAL